jgi:alkylation response protein AidB-like acyl-CoA dehydrogenase
MDLRLTEDELEFRAEVRAFVRESLPASIREKTVAGKHLSKDDYVRWTRILAARGWGAPHWPKQWGGAALSPVKQAIFLDETQRGNAPELIAFGVSMVGPVIYTFGSEAQKERFLPRIIDLRDWWCQGFSEPGAGSDLASLRTTARRDADGWVISGQKTWTTLAQYADWIFVLARTNAQVKKQEGISFFLVDMHQPGIEVRPIRQMTGGGEFCEIFLSDAVVEDRDLVGEPGAGWKIAMTVFGFERGGLGQAARFERAVEQLAGLVRERGAGADVTVRQKVAQAQIEAHIFRLIGLRNLTSAQHGHAPGAEASLTKLYWSEMDKRIQETAVGVQGPYGALAPDSPFAIEEGRWQFGWMWAQGETIYAGSSEIQRNIIAERVLGLPRGR